MQNPFSFLTREKLEASFGILTRRFPIPLIIIFIFSGLLFYFVQSETKSDTVTRAIFTFGVTFFFSTGMALFSEGAKFRKYALLLAGIPILYGVWIYFSLDVGNDWFLESSVYLLLHLFGFVSFLFFAPYIERFFMKNYEEIEYSNYFSMISWALLMAAISGLAILILGFIAISSVFALFDIESLFKQEKFYGHWAVFSLAFIAPLYGLVHLPVGSTISKKTYTINKFFSFLIRYVGVPSIFIYFLILYSYSVKVLLQFSDWPKGIISWMVIGFSAFGYLNYIFSKPYEGESRMVSVFRKYFPLAVVPQIFMLYYAIYLRIAQYDLTMNRYFVVIFGLWLMLSSLYLIVSKKKSLIIITVSLSLLSLLISVGPWSVFRYPLDRQYDRLIANLETANILQNGNITPLASPKDISKELSNDIYSGISYVCDFSECKKIKDLFAKELVDAAIKSENEWKKWNPEDIGATYPGMNKWEIVSAVTDTIKVQQSYAYESKQNTKYIQYNTKYQYNAPYPISIENGYTKIVGISEKTDGVGMYEKGNSEVLYPYITMDPDSETLTYHRSSTGTLNLRYTPGPILEKSTTPTGLEQSDLILMVSSDAIEAKLYLQNFAVKNPEYSGTGGYDYYTISGVGIVKEKR